MRVDEESDVVRYYQLRPNREAWGTSLVIHAWVLVLLLLVPAIKAGEEPLSEPMELTLLDLGAPGDRVQGQDYRPAPKRVQARVREVPPRPVTRPHEPRPAAVREAPVPAAPPPEAVRPRIEEVKQPDLAVLAAEEARRRSVEEQMRRDLEEAGSKQALGGQGTSDEPPPPGGAVGAGRGATGDLAGRRVLSTPTPPYPDAAASRHSEGTVRARLRVGPEGRVVDVEIVQSSGDPDLDQAAAAAFRRWSFSPLPDGAPRVDQLGVVRMNFELR